MKKIGIALLVLLVALVGFGAYVDFGLTRVAAFPEESPDSAGTNWLIVGTDSRANLTEEQKRELATGDSEADLTDTIMLLHTGSGAPTLVSIPRDSLLAIPGHGVGKVNSAYGLGGGADGGGPELLVRTIEGETGLRIDHYIEIGLDGFVSVVDDVGGVDLCVPEAIVDPKAGLDIEAGCQELDQAQALGYVRTRTPDTATPDDFGRVKRQRAFLSALLERITGPTTLLNPFRVVPLASGLSDSVRVGEGDHVWHLANLGLAMRGLSDEGAVTTTVPVADGEVHWDRDRSDDLFDALAKDQQPDPSSLGTI